LVTTHLLATIKIFSYHALTSITPAGIPFPRAAVEKYHTVIPRDFLKMYGEYGGVPVPVTGDHFCTCLATIPRLQKTLTQHGEVYLDQ